METAAFSLILDCWPGCDVVCRCVGTPVCPCTVGPDGTLCCDSTSGFPGSCHSGTACCLHPAEPANTPNEASGGATPVQYSARETQAQATRGGCGGVQACMGCPGSLPQLSGGEMAGWFCCSKATKEGTPPWSNGGAPGDGTPININSSTCPGDKGGNDGCCLAPGLEEGCQGVVPCR